MARIPTDRKILQAIHNRYYEAFITFDEEEPDREAKILIPIDCVEIAGQLKIDYESVFGRLYYHMEKKYGYERENGVIVPFFIKATQRERHLVNFSLLEAVLASLQEEWNQRLWSFGFSIASLVMSLFALGFSIF